VRSVILTKMASHVHLEDKLITKKTVRSIVVTKIHQESQNELEGFIWDHSELISQVEDLQKSD
jgi:hypothetical protein